MFESNLLISSSWLGIFIQNKLIVRELVRKSEKKGKRRTRKKLRAENGRKNEKIQN